MKKIILFVIASLALSSAARGEAFCASPDKIEAFTKAHQMPYRHLATTDQGTVLAVYRTADGGHWAMFAFNSDQGCFVAAGVDWYNYDENEKKEEAK